MTPFLLLSLRTGAHTGVAISGFHAASLMPPLCKGLIPPSAGEMSAQRTKGAGTALARWRDCSSSPHCHCEEAQPTWRSPVRSHPNKNPEAFAPGQHKPAQPSAVPASFRPRTRPVGILGVLLAVGAAASSTDPGHSLGSLLPPLAALPALPPARALSICIIFYTDLTRTHTPAFSNACLIRHFLQPDIFLQCWFMYCFFS